MSNIPRGSERVSHHPLFGGRNEFWRESRLFWRERASAPAMFLARRRAEPFIIGSDDGQWPINPYPCTSLPTSDNKYLVLVGVGLSYQKQ